MLLVLRRQRVEVICGWVLGEGSRTYSLEVKAKVLRGGIVCSGKKIVVIYLIVYTGPLIHSNYSKNLKNRACNESKYIYNSVMKIKYVLRAV